MPFAAPSSTTDLSPTGVDTLLVLPLTSESLAAKRHIASIDTESIDGSHLKMAPLILRLPLPGVILAGSGTMPPAHISAGSSRGSRRVAILFMIVSI